MRHLFAISVLFTCCVYDATASMNTMNNSAEIINREEFNAFIDAVSDGDSDFLKTVPQASEKINNEQSNALRNALIHSLIKSPNDTLDALHVIDKEIAVHGHSPIRDKLGTDSVCSYVIDSNRYDRESFFNYYSVAKLQLEETGKKGKACLELMSYSVKEIILEETNKNIKWGKEKYPFYF